MEYGLKLDPYRRVLPLTRGIEGAPIPSDASIVNKSRVDLPSVRHTHLVPGADGLIASVPTLLSTNVSRISPKPPWAAQADSLQRGQGQCFLACRESRRTRGGRSQNSSLSQEF